MTTDPDHIRPFPEVPLEDWGARVVEARRARRLSQTSLAQASGVTQQTISKVEQGDICPHDRLKVRLAAALDLPPSEVFPWPEQMTPPPRRST